MKTQFGITVFAVIASGCSTAIRSIDRLPLASELRFAADPELVLAHASEDLDLLKAKKNPKYATYKTGLYDGGTRFFDGRGYCITDHRKILTRNGQHRIILGQTIVFDRSVTGGKELRYSNTEICPTDE